MVQLNFELSRCADDRLFSSGDERRDEKDHGEDHQSRADGASKKNAEGAEENHWGQSFTL